MEKTFLTPEGKKQLEDRLLELKTVKRPEVTKKIGIAREFGDLSENAEYDAAKEEQGIIEAEIAEIEVKLRNCEIINMDKLPTNKVSVGCKVKLFDETFSEEVEYQIIGSTESDPLKGLISNESPVGRALLGKKKGETVEVSTPAGTVVYKVLEIKA
ncbi:MAG: transcription elongation factor GreA [Firmicutes bacterium]|nr:transcription elongation factor GreA [Bacillota bacterium]MDY3658739.1 transcription elongation factor GreA [Eubacteriales bacterium]